MTTSSTRPPRAARHADIKRAAIEEFARHGFQGASTQAIAARAGLSKPQLNYYIDGKEDLYREVLLDTMNAWGGLFEFDDAQRGPHAVLSDYIRRKLEFSFDNPLATKIFTGEMLAGAPVYMAYMPVFRRRTAAAATIMRQWMAQGLMRRSDPLQVLMNIWAITQSYADHEVQVRYFMRRKTLGALDRRRIVAHVTQFVLTGLGVRPAPGRSAGPAPVSAPAKRAPPRRARAPVGRKKPRAV
ncbi:MAG: TetR family transcriptional regulator C-terminal domain-containing protein [Burkholderiales bacterium]|nr:TetR family transcriptional regulator C-terminal domain-containing protein [Burkholderiales bacterium]